MEIKLYMRACFHLEHSSRGGEAKHKFERLFEGGKTINIKDYGRGRFNIQGYLSVHNGKHILGGGLRLKIGTSNLERCEIIHY